jgi:hypothetical protein
MNTQRLALALTFANLALLVVTLAQTTSTAADTVAPVLRTQYWNWWTTAARSARA